MTQRQPDRSVGEVVYSHTEGEPTRVVIEGWPPLDGATMAARRDDLLQVNAELERLDQLREQTATARQSKRHAFDRIEQEQDRLEEEMRVISSEQRELVAERERLGIGQTELRNRLEAAEGAKSAGKLPQGVGEVSDSFWKSAVVNRS